jgi:penicillin-binding protein-related factor A (putative recombinase)
MQDERSNLKISKTNSIEYIDVIGCWKGHFISFEMKIKRFLCFI